MLQFVGVAHVPQLGQCGKAEMVTTTNVHRANAVQKSD